MGFVKHHQTHLLPGYKGAIARILDVQDAKGAIAWMTHGPFDPWNHIESVMALTAGGQYEACLAAFEYLTSTQAPDGSWLGEYGNAVPMATRTRMSRTHGPKIRDTNFCAYPATGLLHYFLTTGDRKHLDRYWPMVRAGIDFVLAHQKPKGQIGWCAEADPEADDDALLSACASIYKSLSCAQHLAELLGDPQDHWAHAQHRLQDALTGTPSLFARTLHSPNSFSMDWYYPVLCGAYDERAGRKRLTQAWDTYVRDKLGCVCVVEEPWVTVAESCELALTLLSLGEHATACDLLTWQDQFRDHDGAYWMGYQYNEAIVWPEEKPAWTSAAVVLAADACFHDGATRQIFAPRFAPAPTASLVSSW